MYSRTRRRVVVLVTAVLALALTACGAGGLGDDRPSKDEVREGYAATLAGPSGSLPGGSSNSVVTCVVDGIYDMVSTETLETLAAGSDAYPSEDISTMLSVTAECTKDASGS